MNIQVTVCRVVMLCSDVARYCIHLHPEDGGSKASETLVSCHITKLHHKPADHNLNLPEQSRTMCL